MSYGFYLSYLLEIYCCHCDWCYHDVRKAVLQFLQIHLKHSLSQKNLPFSAPNTTDLKLLLFLSLYKHIYIYSQLAVSFVLILILELSLLIMSWNHASFYGFGIMELCYWCYGIMVNHDSFFYLCCISCTQFWLVAMSLPM